MRARVRRHLAVVQATVVEWLGEPFVFLTLWAALALSVLAPAFHYHQFGEASRLARDAGFSAFLVGGSLAAVFGAIRSIRREVESGTREVALAHALSPGGFLFAKTMGFCLGVCFFSITILAVMLVMVDGMEVGALLAAQNGGLVRPWGPSLAIGVALLILPIAGAALLNRFAAWRFTWTATRLTGILAVAGFCARGRLDLFARYFPVFALEGVPVLLLTVAASIFAFFYRTNVAAAGTGLLALAFLPALGNYCLAEVLAEGGTLPMSFVFLAVASALVFLFALVAFGKMKLTHGEDCV